VDSGAFGDRVTKASIELRAAERVARYSGRHDGWFRSTFLPVLERIDLAILSWEQVLAILPQGEEATAIQGFYSTCLRFSPLRPKGA